MEPVRCPVHSAELCCGLRVRDGSARSHWVVGPAVQAGVPGWLGLLRTDWGPARPRWGLSAPQHEEPSSSIGLAAGDSPWEGLRHRGAALHVAVRIASCSGLRTVCARCVKEKSSGSSDFLRVRVKSFSPVSPELCSSAKCLVSNLQTLRAINQTCDKWCLFS